MRYKIVEPELIRDLGSGVIEAVASTEATDSYGDIIRQTGWDLKRFKRHPVLLAGHNYHSVHARLGHWTKIRVEADGSKSAGTVTGRALVAEAHYDLDAPHDEPKIAYHFAQKGFAAFSVGFKPDMRKVEKILDAEGNWTGGYEFKGQELLEISDVSVPANPETTSRSFDPNLLDEFIGYMAEAVARRLKESPESVEPVDMTGDLIAAIGRHMKGA